MTECIKRKLEASIAVLERLRDIKTIYDTEGTKIAGAYWEPIKQEIKERCVSNCSRGRIDENGEKHDGCIQILFPEQLDTILAECNDKLDEIKKEEYDRELDNKSKHAAIKANRIAKWAIIISVLAATGLPQYLLRWLYKIFLELVCLLNNRVLFYLH